MEEDEEYSVSDSEDDYSKEDKLLLENARSSMKKKEVSSDEEVYGFGESESEGDEGEEEEENEEEDEEEIDMDMGSDLEDQEKPTDDRAWGKRKRSFYSTDFVDQDYEGIYQGEEAEVAELEEQEARNIQKRLVEHLDDVDFFITDALDMPESTEATAKPDVIRSDLTKLSKRQKLDLVKKESPEFFVLVEDFKRKIQETQKLLPVLNYFKSKVKDSFPALDFLQTKLTIILNYCTNISYYLFLKAKRIPVRGHPVLKSLFRYRQLLQQMEDVDNKIMQPQLDKILKKIEAGEEVKLDESFKKKKNTLKLLSKQTERRRKKMAEKEDEQQAAEQMEFEETLEEDKEEKPIQSANEKRAITYQMAKNKGLIPKRSKEQRNPRVKHRKKYEKAKIRRRGQVRTPRAEIPVYGGEPTGIKIGLTKSIKLKY